MKRIVYSVLAVAFSLLIVSCGGTDATPYLSEDVISSVEEGSDTWKELSDMLGVLSVDSVLIPEFDTMQESVDYFGNSMLNYLCCKNYRKYAGNAGLLNEINREYPGMDAIAAISANEFESEMYRVFGGSVKITHKSTELFTYLEKADVYVPITSPVEGGCDFELTKAEETENTYRLEFDASADDVKMSYFALLVKREDGSRYFSMLFRR